MLLDDPSLISNLYRNRGSPYFIPNGSKILLPGPGVIEESLPGVEGSLPQDVGLLWLLFHLDRSSNINIVDTNSPEGVGNIKQVRKGLDHMKELGYFSCQYETYKFESLRDAPVYGKHDFIIDHLTYIWVALDKELEDSVEFYKRNLRPRGNLMVHYSDSDERELVAGHKFHKLLLKNGFSYVEQMDIKDYFYFEEYDLQKYIFLNMGPQSKITSLICMGNHHKADVLFSYILDQ
jgi:hypothetical protein